MRDEAPSGIDLVPSLRWGSHLCQAFERPSDIRNTLIPYFAEGLKNNEACLWVTAPPFAAVEARTALRAAIPDLDSREAANQIEILDVSDWYGRGQAVEPEVLVSDLLQREQDALRLGYQGLRTNGNCSWVTSEQRADFQNYEELIQKTVRGRRMICMCSYGPHQTREPGFHAVMLAHDLLLGPTERTEQPSATTPSSTTIEAENAAVGFEDVFITESLYARPTGPRQSLPLDQLVWRPTDQPSEMLPKLVKVALEICGAASAGVSVLEGDEFRWLGLTGSLQSFEGAKTPRNDSPCGICLDRDAPILMEHPERIYSWIAEADIRVPEVLLVPLRAPEGEQVGTLWIVSDDKGHFDSEHARTISELATFTGMALHMMRTEERLTRALEEKQLVVGEMSHRVKNMYAVAAGIVKMSARKASSAHDMSETVIARLAALGRAHGLAESAAANGVSLSALLESVLEPYSNREISGPPLHLGERAIASLAMTFHELATNALKYGALGTPGGRVTISWTSDGQNATILWKEKNGPPPGSAAPQGFGSLLIRSSIASLGGTISMSWPQTGLELTIGLPLDLLAENV